MTNFIGYDCGSDKLHILLEAKKACLNSAHPPPDSASPSSLTIHTDSNSAKIDGKLTSCIYLIFKLTILIKLYNITAKKGCIL